MIGAATAPVSAEISVDELERAIFSLARHLNAETYRFLVLVREFDDRFGFAKWGMDSCAEWLHWRCGFSLSAAREKVRTAQALRRLPAISAAFAAGRLSYTKARALTRVADAANEELLLAYALETTAPQVEERCRQMRNVAPESVDVSRSAWERRALCVFRSAARGTLTLRVELPVEDGELVARALECAVEAGEVASAVEFATDRALEANGWPAQQADALVALARAYLVAAYERSRDAERAGADERAVSSDAADDGAPRSNDSEAGNEARTIPGAHAVVPRAVSIPDHYQVVVHVEAKALHGGAGRADLPLETIKRLCCDGSVVAVVEDERGTPLDLGRKQRTLSTALRRALYARDGGGCTFPGCSKRLYVEGHHLVHWIDGGRTALANVTTLCRFHHRLLHEGGYTVRRESSGELCFRRADGRVIPRGGYRLDDVLDDDAFEEQATDGRANPSMEGWMAAVVHGRSAHARERWAALAAAASALNASSHR